MKRLYFAAALLLCIAGCRHGAADRTLEEYRESLAASDALVAMQEWDRATDAAVKTLEVSRLLSDRGGA